jgi:molybdopterin converting factor subunit 1
LHVVITVDVLLFASYADSAGAASVRVSVADDARVSDVVQAVRVAAPSIALPARPLVAVNHRYAAADATIAVGDEIAFIPPVAGG